MRSFKRVPRTVVALCVVPLLLGGCERTEIDGIGSITPNEAAPPQLDLVALGDCTVGELGWVSGEGEIRNRSDAVGTYEVVVSFSDADRRLGDQRARIRDLYPGESARFEVHAWLNDDAASMTSCDVVTINRWSARTGS